MSDRPNILLITTDQHRRDTLGCYGADVCETPHIHALAAGGVTFDHAYTVTAICTPARASMLTGAAPFRHKLLANFERNVGYPTELADDTRMIPHYLPEYRCANIGKWHVGQQRGPQSFGFNGHHYEGWHPPYKHPDYLAYLRERNLPGFTVKNEVRGIFPNGEPGIPQMGVHDAPVEATFCHYLTTRTIEQIEQYSAGDTPFFIACQFYGPHLPYYLPEAVLNRYDPAQVAPHPSMAETFAGKPRVQHNYSQHWGMDTLPWETWQKLIAAYQGYVSLIDEQVGRLMAALEQNRLADNTIVIFTADHGGFVGNHRLADKGPAMYDDIYRIPLIVRDPHASTAGARTNAMVSLLDVMPTVLDAAGIAAPDDVPIDGDSFLPYARTPGATGRDRITAEFHGHHFPYPQRMIRTHRHKLVVNPADINELYDLHTDPFELNNIYGHPACATQQRHLMGQLYRHLVEVGDNFHHWMPTMYDMDRQSESATGQALVR
ncbi:MAG: sulfatase-like hydrolase/transferase [Chloroflexota bacterium]